MTEGERRICLLVCVVLATLHKDSAFYYLFFIVVGIVYRWL